MTQHIQATCGLPIDKDQQCCLKTTLHASLKWRKDTLKATELNIYSQVPKVLIQSRAWK